MFETMSDTVRTKTFWLALSAMASAVGAYLGGSIDSAALVAALIAGLGMIFMRDGISKAQVMVAFLCVSALALTGCATSDLASKAGQGSIDQNTRGGVFASYTGKDHSRGAPSTATVKGVVDGQEVDLAVTSASPFVLVFGDLEANTEVATSGTTSDEVANTATPTNKPAEGATLSGLPK